jgi:outer membrane protein OmpA-like peptidoglycan-associated protein
MSPFIHFDNQTLYFSSDGRPGMGGHDLYFTKMNADTSWTDPQNLGYPINTWNDEMGLVIDASGENAFFSTKRDEINGKDIFTFALYENIRPNPVSYFKGTVTDNETGKLLKADYELVDLTLGKVINSGNSGSKGDMLVCLPSGFNYGLNVFKQGYLFYSDNFMLEGIHTASEPFQKNVRLKPIKTGQVLQLSNVFYEFNSSELKKESESELERLNRLLADNKSLIVEIGGYTDSVGSESYNLTLSERRALSVMNYLKGRGISSARLKYRGYGASSPIADNVTEEGRKQNRRTEVRILSADQK